MRLSYLLKGKFPFPSRDFWGKKFICWALADFLELLPRSTQIEQLTGKKELLLYQCIFRENTSVYSWIWTLNATLYSHTENGNSLMWRGFGRADRRKAYFEPKTILIQLHFEYDLSSRKPGSSAVYSDLPCIWGFLNKGLSILSLKRAHNYETRRKVWKH